MFLVLFRSCRPITHSIFPLASRVPTSLEAHTVLLKDFMLVSHFTLHFIITNFAVLHGCSDLFLFVNLQFATDLGRSFRSYGQLGLVTRKECLRQQSSFRVSVSGVG